MQSPRSVIGSQAPPVDSEDPEDLKVAGTEPASAWTGAKKPKIQSIPTTPGSQAFSWPDEIEGWDDKKLCKEINILRDGLRTKKQNQWTPYSSDDDDDDYELSEEDQKAVNQRLALCRIRGREEHLRVLDDKGLLKLFAPDILESNCYYIDYEAHCDWFFDPEYSKFKGVEHYQLLVLRVTAEFGDLDIDPYAHHKLEDDQQFAQFWEMLSSKTELIEKYITGKSCERRRIENMLLYHALKLAETLPSVYKTTFISRFREFMMGVKGDYTHAGFLTKMCDLIAKNQVSQVSFLPEYATPGMKFEDAVKLVFDEGKYRSIFRWGIDFDSNLSHIQQIYKPHVYRIVERTHVKKSRDDVHQMVMDTIVENFWKPRSYYDYVRKKLRIAEEIGLIPKQLPHRLYSPDSVLKIACHAET